MIGPVLALLAVSTLPTHASERKPIMEITHKADLKTVDGSAQYFTGRVTITGQFQREAPSRVGGAIVDFEPGARTAWHTHPLGQTLLDTEGAAGPRSRAARSSSSAPATSCGALPTTNTGTAPRRTRP